MRPCILSVVPRGYMPWLRGGLELTARSVLEALVELSAGAHLAAGMPPESRTLPRRIARKLLGPYASGYAIDRHHVHTDLYHPVDLARLVDRLKPEMLVCHVAGNNPHVRKVIELDLPTFFYVHGSRLGGAFDGVDRMARVRFAAESSFIADLVTRTTGKSVDLIRPLLDPTSYRVGAKGDAVLVVNPHPLKGGGRVVELAAALPHRRFLVVGGWASTRQHEDMLQIEKSLASLRNVERIAHVDDMREVFQRSRCLLMPCIVEEAYGRAAAEALIAGIPVIASDRGALPETVGAGGVTLSPDAPLQDWLKGLEAMFDDDAHYQRLASDALLQAAEYSRQPQAVLDALGRLVAALLQQ